MTALTTRRRAIEKVDFGVYSDALAVLKRTTPNPATRGWMYARIAKTVDITPSCARMSAT